MNVLISSNVFIYGGNQTNSFSSNKEKITLGCTVAGIKNDGLGLAHYNAYCSGSIQYDDDGDPKYVTVSAGSNGEGLESGNGNTNVTGRKLNGVKYNDPDSYTVPSDEEYCGSSNGGTVLRATSNATAHAYVDGTLPNSDKAGRTVDIEWDAARKKWTCREKRKNPDGTETIIECVPPDPHD